MCLYLRLHPEEKLPFHSPVDKHSIVTYFCKSLNRYPVWHVRLISVPKRVSFSSAGAVFGGGSGSGQCKAVGTKEQQLDIGLDGIK